jgi:hypothetical protein
MEAQSLLVKLAEQKVSPQEIAAEVVRRPQLLPDVLAGLAAREARVKYGCSKLLLLVADYKPLALYPYLDALLPFLDSDNRVLKWTAIGIIGSLAGVDSEHKLDRFLPVFYKFLSAGNMITANNTIAALADIAVARPDLQREITEELLRVEGYRYDTAECLNIALGKVILAFKSYLDKVSYPEEVLQLALRQTHNSRAATAKKAAAFLHKTGARASGQALPQNPEADKLNLSIELVAPCGMNCGVCKSYLAYSRQIPRRKGITYCNGCRPRGKKCAYIKAQCRRLAKHEIEFCFQCDDFPCPHLQTLDARYRARFATSFIQNLKIIRDAGIEAFLRSEEARWRCPQCGGTVSIHDKLCYDCSVK